MLRGAGGGALEDAVWGPPCRCEDGAPMLGAAPRVLGAGWERAQT